MPILLTKYYSNYVKLAQFSSISAIAISLTFKFKKMKQFVILLGSLLSFGLAKAQKFDDIKNTILLRQYEKAKPMLDTYLANEKNAKNADAWYYKGFIEAAMGTDVKNPKICDGSCRNKALETFAKYLTLDKDAKLLKEEGNVSLAVIYGNAFDSAINEYNKKNYGVAFKEFVLALKAEEFMWNNKLIYAPKDQTPFPSVPFDTSLILNAGVSAELNKDVDNALKYYQKLADINVAGKQNQILYEYLADNYTKRGNKAAADAIFAKVITIYPDADIFISLELDALPKDTSKEVLYAKYDELIAKYPASFYLNYNYAFDMYKNLYLVDSVKFPNKDLIRNKLSNQIINSIKIDKGNEANVLMALHVSGWSYEIKDIILGIKGQKPEDQKKRNTLKDEAKKKLESAEPYADAAIATFATMTKLKTNQQVNYKKMYDIKREIAKGKGDAKKQAEYEKKIEEIGKM